MLTSGSRACRAEAGFLAEGNHLLDHRYHQCVGLRSIAQEYSVAIDGGDCFGRTVRRRTFEVTTCRLGYGVGKTC